MNRHGSTSPVEAWLEVGHCREGRGLSRAGQLSRGRAGGREHAGLTAPVKAVHHWCATGGSSRTHATINPAAGDGTVIAATGVTLPPTPSTDLADSVVPTHGRQSAQEDYTYAGCLFAIG